MLPLIETNRLAVGVPYSSATFGRELQLGLLDIELSKCLPLGQIGNANTCLFLGGGARLRAGENPDYLETQDAVAPQESKYVNEVRTSAYGQLALRSFFGSWLALGPYLRLGYSHIVGLKRETSSGGGTASERTEINYFDGGLSLSVGAVSSIFLSSPKFSRLPFGIQLYGGFSLEPTAQPSDSNYIWNPNMNMGPELSLALFFDWK